MAETLKTFGASKDGWGPAFWFAGQSSALDDECPQDALATNAELVISTVADEMAELQHG